MTKSDGIRIITELEAAEKLLARGYTRKDCPACDGRGHLTLEEGVTFRSVICVNCEGAGWVWVEPPSDNPSLS